LTKRYGEIKPLPGLFSFPVHPGSCKPIEGVQPVVSLEQMVDLVEQRPAPIAREYSYFEG
jgi:hypothetical protein